MADHPEAKRSADDAAATGGVCLFLAAIVWLAFGQTLGHSFVNYDDNIYIYQNATVLAGLTGRGIPWAFSFAEIGHWHPVTWFSHMLDCWLFGLRSGGHHLTNVALHATAAILLFLALKEMTGSLWRSAVVAALFAIHPQRVESVAWIAERKDVLSGAFFMATLLAYSHYVKQPSAIRSALIAILFALGLMSKGMLVTLPFVLLLLDYWPLRRVTPEMLGALRQPEKRAGLQRIIAEKIPLLLLSAASCLMTSLSPEKIAPALQMSFPARVENAVVSYVIYLKQMVYPVGLVLPYFNSPAGFPLTLVLAALALLIAISVGTFLLRRKQPYLIVGWLWYLGMMTPVIGLVQISYYARADRYTYLPEIGLYLLATWGAVEVCRRWRGGREVLAAIALLLIAALTMLSRAQAAHWRDSETLWRYVLSQTPDNYIAHNNMGLALDEKGQTDAAITHFEKALQIQPGYAETHNNFGNALCRVGRVPDAIVQYEEALELVPGLPQVHNNLGTAFGQNGQTAEAIGQFRKALEINPSFAGAHSNLGFALLISGENHGAEQEFKQAIELRPKSIEPRKHLAGMYLKEGRTAEAIALYRQVLELAPDDSDALSELARLPFVAP